MKNLKRSFYWYALTASIGSSALAAEPISIHWNSQDLPNFQIQAIPFDPSKDPDMVVLAKNLAPIFQELSLRASKQLQKLVKFDPNQFLVEKSDSIDLAFSHYYRFIEKGEDLPIEGRSLRIWTTREINGGKQQVIQVEALLDEPAAVLNMTQVLAQSTHKSSRQATLDLVNGLSQGDTYTLVREAINKDGRDTRTQEFKFKDHWRNGSIVRIVKVKGRRGIYKFVIDLQARKILTQDYSTFPNSDDLLSSVRAKKVQELTPIPVRVFPVYEEVEATIPPAGGIGTLMQPIDGTLKHVYSLLPAAPDNVFEPLRHVDPANLASPAMHYYEGKFNPTLGETEAGRKQGYWAMSYVKDQARQIREALPLTDNSFAASTGLTLWGKYVTINLFPQAFERLQGIEITKRPLAALWPDWQPAADPKLGYEMIPSSAFAAKSFKSEQEIYTVPIERLPDHNPAKLLNNGFDTVQVYWAVDTLFDTLAQNGWSDPEISTRPFNAFLYNPDIEWQDNAFYTDDTINFTTYSKNSANMARDNSTVWHELGHGVMDRLMGDNIVLADTGGLSEGMADFVAAMVIQGVMKGQSFEGDQTFRIINHTVFNTENEVHDDGEAYGGSMRDFMMAVVGKYGNQVGLNKVVDLVMETMRLTRDNPGLTANGWFGHMLFADQLGRPGIREAGELTPLLQSALQSRNFRFDGGQVATYTLSDETQQPYDNNPHELIAGSPGTRDHGIQVPLAKDAGATASFNLKASVKNSDQFQFKFPVQIKVFFNSGPLQGAVHWVGEEKGEQVYTLNSENDVANIPLAINGVCDAVNREDGSCVDYAYVQVWSNGETDKPSAKKRFYVQVRNPAPAAAAPVAGR